MPLAFVKKTFSHKFVPFKGDHGSHIYMFLYIYIWATFSGFTESVVSFLNFDQEIKGAVCHI